MSEPERGHHQHNHGQGDHDHQHGDRPDHRLHRLLDALPFVHSHGAATLDETLEGSARGLWALKVSLVGLGVTAAIQLAIVAASGSVGLLADSVHNVADALTAVPLGLAFLLARRPPSRRYTYGLGRAEELAGVAIVLTIFASALVAAWESYQRLLHPQPLRYVGWVIAAALIGFLGNEAVAVFRVRVGRQIGSAALVADGQHARVDGFTSLAVLVGAVLVLAGFPLADPIVGLLITVVILLIVRGTAVTMWHRLLDGVDPQVTADIEAAALRVPAVQAVGEVRVRWVGHQLHAELNVVVDGDLPTRISHQIGEDVRRSLRKALPRLATATIHVDPLANPGQPSGAVARG
jgi:cation diffusion facilitator family transporter